jgi:preprotein translocase subunit YajC
MKLTFKQKNTIRLGVLLIILLGIGVFIYFELKKEQEFNNNLETNLINEMSSGDKYVSKNNINEAGGLKIQQYAATTALKNNGKIDIDEISKIHSLNNE